MRNVELARRSAFFAPRFNELAILGEFHDSSVGFPTMSIRNKNVTVHSDHDIRRPIEGILTIAGNVGLAQHHQELARGAELEDGISLAVDANAVGGPDISFAIDEKPVWPVKQAGAEANYQFAIAIEFLNRINRFADWIHAAFRTAAIQHPDAFAVRIDFDANHLAPRPLRRKPRPVLHDAERIG